MKKIFPYTLCALVALLMFSCEPLIKPQHHFSVLFDANGGDGDMDAQILAEGVIDHLAESSFKREGYTFVGWNTAPDGSGTSYDDAALFKTDQNITLYAQWEKLLFPLFFEANGGSGNMSAQMIKYDESTALNENTFIRGGYRFTGWNTEADGSGKAYKDKQAIVITQESYLYAQWTMLSSGTENGHSYIDLGLPSGLKWASFNLGAKTPEGSGDYFAWGETEPKKEYSWESYKWSIYSDGAYKMTKYNTDSHYGTVVDNKESLEIEDDAAHVNWQGKWRMPTSVEYAELINYCTWTWASQNGISGFIVKSEVNDNSIFLPAAGWYVKSGCEYISKWGFYWLNNLTPGISPLHAYYWKFYSELYKQPYDHIDYVSRYYGMPIRPVYAEFAIVTFNANGGQGEMPAQQFAIGESQALMSNAFTRAGYNFTGWSTAPDGSGTAYYNHQIISPEQNLTLYAQWEIIPAIVTFDANGGQGTMAPQIFDPTVLQALNANTFTRDGHMFTGWNTAPDGSGTSFNDQAEVMIGGDLTLYAQWYAVSGFENEHAYVDLGLPSGTKWAICNLGATAPEGYGDYFAWGETAPKSHYNWSYYKHNRRSGTVNSLLKYNNNVNNGVVDNKTTLDAEDDAATVNWGGRWRIPSQTEQNELITNCNLTWVQQKGVNGYKLTSKINGNSIFLPAAGYRYNADLVSVGTHAYYWANSLYTFSSFDAVNLYYERTLVSVGKYSSRCIGYTVRAVISDDTPQTTIYTLTFDANGGTGSMAAQTFEEGVSQALAANTFTRSGYNFTGWNTSPDGSGTSYTDKQIITLTQDIMLYAQWEQEQMVSGTENGHDYVDLGLPSGLKWATCNIGASTPEGSGDYFAWGETSPKDNCEWSTYKYCNGSYTTLTKYNTYSNFGTVDNKITLDLIDDAARVNWGGKWRMPTTAEQDELINNCTWTWTAQNGVEGYKVASKTNGNSIFLPAAGNRNGTSVVGFPSGFYWSSSLNESGPYGAYRFHFNSGSVSLSNFGRDRGHTVRAVFSENDTPSTFVTITFNANGGSGTMSAQTFEAGVSQVLAANIFTRSGYIFTGWNTSPDGSGNSYTDKQSIVLTQDMALYAQWEVIATTGVENGYEWVDLGLPSGLKWATCNVGATSPEECGDYFMWGASKKHDSILKSWPQCPFYKSGTSYQDVTFTQYNDTDGKIVLEYEHDAASQNLGGSWRMPTKIEYEELISKCEWIWTIQNDVNGYMVLSKINGNSIFFPAQGSSTFYWSSSLRTVTEYLDFYGACALWITSLEFGCEGAPNRMNTNLIRAVCP